ncbi:MAG: LysM peptidoglycan-binding domain-containing protein [Candidatus Methylopumilus sp.]|nr:LysM peptidoglycan-binding domain-containing protein [Candidatus Methylopumilus sp.]
MESVKQMVKKLFFICLLLFPFIGHSFQLGKIIVSSSQGQLFNAEIEMMLAPSEDTSKLLTSIASKENYDAQGIERLAIHNNITVELQKNEKGLTVLKLKSTQPVLDPFLDLLVQVDSSKGRNYREYTVLLDPPEMPIIQQEKIVAVDKKNSISTIETKDIAENIDKNKSSIVKDIKNTPNTTEKVNLTEIASKSITVKSNDTIYKIARENKIPGITTEQMVVAIFNLNELAFVNKNINRVEIGQKIVLPTKDDFLKLSHAQAIAEIKIQTNQWNQFSDIEAESVVLSPKKNNIKDNDEITLQTIIQNPVTSKSPRIKLTGDLLNDKNSKDVVQKEINQINDDKIALEKNIKDAEQKILILEKELADAKKILAFSNQSLFELQEKAKQVNQNKDSVIDTKPDLTSLISKNNANETSKNDVITSSDASFKSSISDGPTKEDEKTNAQLESDKEPSNVSISYELFIFLSILLVILIMLFIIKTKKRQGQRDLISSINNDNLKRSQIRRNDKPEIKEEKIEIKIDNSGAKQEMPDAKNETSISSVKKEGLLEEINLSGIEINLSSKNKKPSNLD